MSPTPLRIGRFAALALLLSTAACSPPADASPKQSRATPETFEAVLAKAGPGDTIVLAPGEYTKITIRDATFTTPVVIDARAATIVGLTAKRVKGLTFRGGDFRIPPPVIKASTGQLAYGAAARLDAATDITFRDAKFIGLGDPEGKGAFGEGYGILQVAGANIEVSNNQFIGLKAGVVMNRIDGFKVTRNRIVGSRADGIVFGESRNGLIENNECLAFRIRDKEHPDCIQLWSRPTSPPTADVVIRGNKAAGNMQGIGMFNHVRDGVDDGGYDRILIENNDMQVGFPQGIALVGSRESMVRNNRVSTFPGAKWRGTMSIGETPRCGNVIEPGAGRGGEKDKACQN